MIDSKIEKDLFEYLGGICRGLDCTPLRVGGHRDHIHILCILSKKITIEELLKRLKQNSSKWIKTKGSEYKNFYWQNGYAVFSVDYRGVEVVSRYIDNQAEHHKRVVFKEEFLNLMNEHDIEYNLDYLWD